MARSFKYEAGVGCLMVAAAGALGFMALQMGSFDFRDEITVTASLADASGLAMGASVSVAGVDVGTLRGLAVQDGRAVATLGIYPSAGIRKDALVRVRARSVLGEKYLEIESTVPVDPSTGLLEEGDVLRSPGRGQVGIDEMVNAMGPLVERLGPVVEELDTEAIGAAVRALTQSLQEDPERVSRMLKNLDEILQNGAETSRELPALARESRSAIRSARSTLTEVDSAVADARRFLANGEELLSSLEEASTDAPEIVREARDALREVRAVVATFGESSEQIGTVLDNLVEIDKWELRRLLREEGILVRFRPREVTPEEAPFRPEGKVRGRR